MDQLTLLKQIAQGLNTSAKLTDGLKGLDRVDVFYTIGQVKLLGLIQTAQLPPARNEDKGKIIYELTEDGQKVLDAESHPPADEGTNTDVATPTNADTTLPVGTGKPIDVHAFRTWMNAGSDESSVDLKKRGVIVAHLEQVCGNTYRRRVLLQFLFDVTSIKDCNFTQLNRIYQWLGPVNAGSKQQSNWVVRKEAYQTALAVFGPADEQLTITERAVEESVVADAGSADTRNVWS